MGLAWLADDAVALSSHLGAIHRHQKRQNQIMSCCFFFLISCYFQNFNGISPVSWVSSYHHFLCLGNCCCWIVNRCGDFLGISMYWECLLGSNIWNKIFIAIPNPSMKFQVLWIWYSYPLIVQHASGKSTTYRWLWHSNLHFFRGFPLVWLPRGQGVSTQCQMPNHPRNTYEGGIIT